jgi:hypothetical protein
MSTVTGGVLALTGALGEKLHAAADALTTARLTAAARRAVLRFMRAPSASADPN